MSILFTKKHTQKQKNITHNKYRFRVTFQSIIIYEKQ